MCTYTKSYGNSDFRNHRKKNKEKRTIIPSPSPHIWELTSTQLLAFGLPGRKEQRTLSTLMMAFQPWNFALLSSPWRSRRDLAFVKPHLLYSFHYSFGTWRWNYRYTISYFLPKWCHADVSYTIMHRNKKKPAFHASQFVSGPSVSKFWLFRQRSFLFFFRIWMSNII